MDEEGIEGNREDKQHSQQFNFTQKYNEMCRSRLATFLNECNKAYVKSDSDLKEMIAKLTLENDTDNHKQGRKFRPNFNKRGNKMFQSEEDNVNCELDERQKQ